MSSAVSALYKNQVAVLWVEDSETKDYLSTIWPGKRFAYLVAAGRESVRPAVNDARRNRTMYVFGVCDRDFGPCNQNKWSAGRDFWGTFVLPRFEIENYLLDADALAHALKPLSTNQWDRDCIEEVMAARAADLKPWLVVRRVLAAMYNDMHTDFPLHPRADQIDSDTDPLELVRRIAAQIEETRWKSTATHRLSQTTPSGLAEAVHHEWQRAETELANGHWKSEWPGKEILERTLAHAPGYEPKHLSNVVKGVGKRHTETQARALEFAEILSTIEDSVHSLKEKVRRSAS